MAWTQHFTIGGKYLGSSVRNHTTWTHDAAPPDGFSYCCPTCGSLWASCPVVDRPFHFLTRGCPQHQQVSNDGSLWTSWDTDFTDAWPPELLRIELQYLLQLLL
jgi:hypothetical protein